MANFPSSTAEEMIGLDAQNAIQPVKDNNLSASEPLKPGGAEELLSFEDRKWTGFP